MKKVSKDILDFGVRSIFAGIIIGMAAIAYLICCLKSSAVVGAVMFSFALLMIFIMELRLFTGSIALIPETPKKRLWVLPVSFFGNLIGVMLVALLVYSSAIGPQIEEIARTVVETKLDHGLFSAFLTAILCGICISFSVVAANEAIGKGFQPMIFIIFPVVIFVLCGFEHSVANLAYFAFAKAALTWDVVWFFALIILGNLLGGPLILLTKKFSKWAKKDDAKKE